MTRSQKAKVTIPHGLAIWPHELSTANALVNAGYNVQFLPTTGSNYAKAPDILINGESWELKSPRTDKLSAVERNLKKATKQSNNIIIDSQRMSKIHDNAIQAFLSKKYRQQRTIHKLLFINRKRQVIDIRTLP